MDALRDRPVASVSLSKRHSVALTTAGEVIVWGLRQVSPTRLPVHNTRDTARSAKAVRVLAAAAAAAGGGGGGGAAAKWSSSRRGGSGGGGVAAVRAQVRFHRDNAAVVTPTIVAVAAGGAHTTMLTSTGAVLAYRSDDAAQSVQEVQGVLGGKCVVKIAAGKTRTIALTDTGEVYAWEGATLTSGAELSMRSASPARCAGVTVRLCCRGSRAGAAGGGGGAAGGERDGVDRAAARAWPTARGGRGGRGEALGGAAGAVASAALPAQAMRRRPLFGWLTFGRPPPGHCSGCCVQGFWIPALPDTLDLAVLKKQVDPGVQAVEGREEEEPADAHVPDEDSEALSAMVRTRQQARAGHACAPPQAAAAASSCIACSGSVAGVVGLLRVHGPTCGNAAGHHACDGVRCAGRWRRRGRSRAPPCLAHRPWPPRWAPCTAAAPAARSCHGSCRRCSSAGARRVTARRSSLSWRAWAAAAGTRCSRRASALAVAPAWTGTGRRCQTRSVVTVAPASPTTTCSGARSAVRAIESGRAVDAGRHHRSPRLRKHGDGLQDGVR